MPAFKLKNKNNGEFLSNTGHRYYNWQDLSKLTVKKNGKVYSTKGGAQAFLNRLNSVFPNIFEIEELK